MAEPLNFFLETILSSAQRVQAKTAQHTFQSLTGPTGKDDFDVICCRFLIITECVIQIRDHYPETFSRLDDAQKIIAFRTLLTHRFYHLDPQEVWRIAGQHLTTLVSQVQTHPAQGKHP